MHKIVHVLTQVQLNEQGGIKSTHRLLGGEDEEELATWPSGGLVHLSHAMFVEAVRRETYTMAITQLSTGKDAEDLTPNEVEQLTRAQLIEMADRVAPEIAREVVAMIQQAEAADEGVEEGG